MKSSVEKIMNIKNYIKAGLILPLVFGLINTLQADEIPMDQAIAYALKNSPVLQGSAAGVRASRERVKSAESGKLPVIDLDYGLIYSDNPLVSLGSKLNNRQVISDDFAPEALNNPGFSDNYFASLSIKLPVYTGGKLTAEIDRSRAEQALAIAQHQHTKSTVAYQVKRAYLLAQAAQQAIQIARSSTSRAKNHVRTTEQLLSENRTVSSDSLTAKVYYTSVKAVISQAEKQYQQALNNLKLAMGKDLSSDISVVPWMSTQAELAIPSGIDAETTALNNRSDLTGSGESIVAAKARTRIAQSAAKPQFGIEARSNLYADDPLVDELSWGILAVAKINLFSGGANKSRINAAQEEALRLQADKRKKELEIRNQVRNVMASIKEARIRLELSTENLINARTAVKQINQRYGEGRTILIDLLQSEQALLKTHTESLNSRLLLEASLVELQFAMNDFEEIPK